MLLRRRLEAGLSRSNSRFRDCAPLDELKFFSRPYHFCHQLSVRCMPACLGNKFRGRRDTNSTTRPDEGDCTRKIWRSSSEPKYRRSLQLRQKTSLIGCRAGELRLLETNQPFPKCNSSGPRGRKRATTLQNDCNATLRRDSRSRASPHRRQENAPLWQAALCFRSASERRNMRTWPSLRKGY